MNRIITLCRFIIGDLARSLQVVIPPALGLVLLSLTGARGMNAGYFASVSGAELLFVCFVTTVLLVSRVNRGSTYPLLARLPHRSELLIAVASSAILITGVLALIFLAVAKNLWDVELTPSELLSLAPRWLALWVFGAAMGLNVGKLTSRGGSYLLVIGIVVFVGAVGELRFILQEAGLEWLIDAVAVIVAPLDSIISVPLGTVALDAYGMPILQLFTYALVLFLLATLLFHRKDLTWAE